MKRFRRIAGHLALLLLPFVDRAECLVLEPGSFERYVREFNQQDEELYPQAIPNSKAWEFLRTNIPWFDCPDSDLETIYYFRWWTYRKHIERTPEGFVITEFLPRVPWAGKYNTISCAAGHHFYEGRWLHDPRYLNDYAAFWFRRGGEPRRYSFWAADSLWAKALVDRDFSLPESLLGDLVVNYEAWEKDHFDASIGLFHQSDDRDGMEVSVGGSGYRATINSYMYGDAMAISQIAKRAGKIEIADRFSKRAEGLRRATMEHLWDTNASFFKVLPRKPGASLVSAKELHGYTPWYFHLVDSSHAAAWRDFSDPQGFNAPFGLTTVERRSPGFTVSYQGHECQWNGPSWPYATSIALSALANLLNGPSQTFVRKEDYFEALKTYAKAQHLQQSDGRVTPWIDENLNPLTGDWLSRTRLKTWKEGTWSTEKGGRERGKDYNHSTFCDLVISGLVGLRPRNDDTVEVNPLLPDGKWDWFCLDDVAYRGRRLTILWDKGGEHYHHGAGLQIFADGKRIAFADRLERVTGPLPEASPANETTAGWRKFEGNPVLGGKLGTCFDVAVFPEEGKYLIWFSWRPKKSIARVESADGIHWSEPEIALGPNLQSDWESDINRPAIVKRDGAWFMWYTGQAKGHSWIGTATSSDGKAWNRAATRPVLSPDVPWEKVAAMCPDVIWDDAERQFRMWYSGGDQYEPDAIGYATSPDGINWTKHGTNPIFTSDRKHPWEQHKVTACQVVRRGDWHYMFYIGFRDVDHAQIGLARSKDGITGWERLDANPIIRPGTNRWDHDACYKPSAIFDGHRWMLWYNGRHGGVEQIGLATHDGEDLGFDTVR